MRQRNKPSENSTKTQSNSNNAPQNTLEAMQEDTFGHALFFLDDKSVGRLRRVSKKIKDKTEKTPLPSSHLAKQDSKNQILRKTYGTLFKQKQARHEKIKEINSFLFPSGFINKLTSPLTYGGGSERIQRQLKHVIEMGASEIMEKFISEQKADNSFCEIGYNLLLHAFNHNQMDCFCILACHFSEYFGLIGFFKQNKILLHTAVKEKKIEFIRALPYFGAGIGVTDEVNETPITLALKTQDLVVVEALFYRASRFASYGKTIPWSDWFSSLTQVPKQKGFFSQKVNQPQLLHYAAATAEDCGSPLIEFLAKTFDVNVVDSHGFTPLHYAALEGNVRCVEELLKAGANPMIYSAEGGTALDLAKNTELANTNKKSQSQQNQITGLLERAFKNKEEQQKSPPLQQEVEPRIQKLEDAVKILTKENTELKALVETFRKALQGLSKEVTRMGNQKSTEASLLADSMSKKVFKSSILEEAREQTLSGEKHWETKSTL